MEIKKPNVELRSQIYRILNFGFIQFFIELKIFIIMFIRIYGKYIELYNH